MKWHARREITNCLLRTAHNLITKPPIASARPSEPRNIATRYADLTWFWICLPVRPHRLALKLHQSSRYCLICKLWVLCRILLPPSNPSIQYRYFCCIRLPDHELVVNTSDTYSFEITLYYKLMPALCFFFGVAGCQHRCTVCLTAPYHICLFDFVTAIKQPRLVLPNCGGSLARNTATCWGWPRLCWRRQNTRSTGPFYKKRKLPGTMPSLDLPRPNYFIPVATCV